MRSNKDEYNASRNHRLLKTEHTHPVQTAKSTQKFVEKALKRHKKTEDIRSKMPKMHKTTPKKRSIPVHYTLM